MHCVTQSGDAGKQASVTGQARLDQSACLDEVYWMTQSPAVHTPHETDIRAAIVSFYYSSMEY